MRQSLKYSGFNAWFQVKQGILSKHGSISPGIELYIILVSEGVAVLIVIISFFPVHLQKTAPRK